MRRLLVVLAAAILVGASGAPSAASAKKANVFPPTAHPFGASYGEWQARWFEWLIEIPAPTNPQFDETGALCGVGQSGPVWFLAPVVRTGTTTRACTIPKGTGIGVLGIGNECSNIEPPPFFGATEAELRECAAFGYETFFEGATASIIVDGIVVSDLDRYRMQTPLFSYTLPVDNVYGLPPGEATKAISDGQIAIVRPLSPGAHTIVTHIDAPFGTIDVVYHITIA
jgi:hypothetical protein